MFMDVCFGISSISRILPAACFESSLKEQSLFSNSITTCYKWSIPLCMCLWLNRCCEGDLRNINNVRSRDRSFKQCSGLRGMGGRFASSCFPIQKSPDHHLRTSAEQRSSRIWNDRTFQEWQAWILRRKLQSILWWRCHLPVCFCSTFTSMIQYFRITSNYFSTPILQSPSLLCTLSFFIVSAVHTVFTNQCLLVYWYTLFMLIFGPAHLHNLHYFVLWSFAFTYSKYTAILYSL